MARLIGPAALAIYRELLAGPTSPPHLLAARMDEATASDPGLREEILVLLAAERRSGAFLEEPPVQIDEEWLMSELRQAVSGAELDAAPPRRIGGFTLLRRIASGGAGTVYEASQEEPRRRVAIKLLRVAAASPCAVRRLLDEASILGRLGHRGIAAVHAAGIEALSALEGGATSADEQLAFIAMELVEDSTTIVRHCDDRQLDLGQRLHLFLEVCDAVQHAHLHGVIHRDLKPANVLVGTAGAPKVVDFGIARLVDSDHDGPRQTEAGQILGTIGHMSPEQLATGVTDARSDVYGLGTILYELLCGRPPHDVRSCTLGEALRIVQETRIPAPTSLARRIPHDLEAVVMQAVAAEPAARYQSVASLADDLRRFLAATPVMARPPGPIHAIGLFARRNRGLAAVVAVAASAVVAAMALAGIHWRRAVVAREESVALREAQAEAVRSLTRQLGPDGQRLLAGFLFASLTPEERSHFDGVAVCCVPRPDGQPAPLVVADATGRPIRRDDLRIGIPAWVSPRASGECAFAVVDACVEEIDAASPGREIIVMLRTSGGSRTQQEVSLLRIYDLSLRTLREAWTTGRLTSFAWNSRAGVLVVSIDALWMQYFLPELAAYDASHCRSYGPGLPIVVGLDPQSIHGVILPTEGPFVQGASASPQGIGTPVRWAIARRPTELRHADGPGRVGSVRVELPACGDDPAAACALVENVSLASSPGEQGSAAGPELRATLDNEGRLLACTDFDHFRDRFLRVDVESLRRGKALADSAITASRGTDGATEWLLARTGLDPVAHRGAVARLAALKANWRWLNLLADSSLMRDEDAVAPGDDEQALDLARRACALHDSRCPDPERCRVRWYVLDTLAIALYRNGMYEEALTALRDCERRWETAGTGLRPHVAGEVAIAAVCLDRLGRHDEAQRELARAEAELATSEPLGGSTEALLIEARQLLRSTPDAVAPGPSEAQTPGSVADSG